MEIKNNVKIEAVEVKEEKKLNTRYVIGPGGVRMTMEEFLGWDKD